MTLTPPSHWHKESQLEWPPGSGNIAATVYVHRLAVGLKVLASKSTLRNGEEWLHISVSRPDRLPTWEEITKVKTEFLGEDIEAYHVVPSRKDYINAHRYCLHLWSPCDGKRRVANPQDIKWETAI